MDYCQYILIFLFFTIIANMYYIYCVFSSQKHKKEGFESLTNCLKQGYPPEFCKRVPIQACLQNCPVGTFEEKKFNTFPL